MTREEFADTKRRYDTGETERVKANGRGPGLTFMVTEENGFVECEMEGCEHRAVFVKPARYCGLHGAVAFS